ncbi:MAG: OmpA family protein [Myxococcota bacterium]
MNTMKTLLLGLALVSGCASTQKAAQTVAGARIVGDHIELDKHVKFSTGEAVILEESFELLDSVATILKVNQDIAEVSVEGHTDTTGDAAFNQDLSQRRAQSVVEYLKSKGVEKQLDAKGFGKDQPLCSEDTDECHSKNRRVEFIIKTAG